MSVFRETRQSLRRECQSRSSALQAPAQVGAGAPRPPHPQSPPPHHGKPQDSVHEGAKGLHVAAQADLGDGGNTRARRGQQGGLHGTEPYRRNATRRKRISSALLHCLASPIGTRGNAHTSVNNRPRRYSQTVTVADQTSQRVWSYKSSRNVAHFLSSMRALSGY